MTGFTLNDVPDLAGKCYIVTGANTGIGFAAAEGLASKGARVLLACRDEGRAQAAMDRICTKVPRADLAFLPLDLADIASLPHTVDLAGREPRIDALINNAGLMGPPLSLTAQGVELHFGVNHLGPFALTALFLPLLAQTPGARVVLTSSVSYKGATIDWDDLAADKSYSRAKRYAASKLANLLFLLELDRRLQAAHSPVMALGCHPGMASTDVTRNMPKWLQFGKPLSDLLLNTPAQAALPALMAATSADVVPGGFYGPQGFMEGRGPVGPIKRSPRAWDKEAALRLWNLSEKLTGIEVGLPAA